MDYSEDYDGDDQPRATPRPCPGYSMNCPCGACERYEGWLADQPTDDDEGEDE